ncbi:hypothetical protein [Ulvibacterium marinum]|uniref:hypothetical protein n=1 Tax=Ulvibacterium marinum TaxID=2419782 RepID=UPI0024957527|nr:hypothetical protein [Ulvibacterium marinum]
MEDINWIQIGIGVLGGGAFGALINQYFHHRRNKVQPIGRNIELKSFFNATDNSSMSTQISITGTTEEHKFTNIFTASIQLINKGNSDFEEFDFGITLPESIKAIKILKDSADRHHQINLNNEPTLENQINEFDITLKPFNRKDVYDIDLQLTSENGEIKEGDIVCGTSHSIKFVDIVSPTEKALEIAKSVAIGPMIISLNKY